MSGFPIRTFERLSLAFSIVALLALTIGSLAVGTVNGYEISLYDGVGPVQYFVPIAYASARAVVFSSVRTGSTNWKRGFALVSGTYGVFFFWPVLRGYALYGRGGADVLSHLGQTKTLLRTGHIVDSASDPVVYYLIGSFRVMGFDYAVAVVLLALLFLAIFVAGVALALRWPERTRRHTILAAALASPLLFTTFHVTTHPAILSFMIVPAGYAAYRRFKYSGEHSYIAIALPIAAVVVLFHPVTAGMFTALILVSEVVDLLMVWIKKDSSWTSLPFRERAFPLFVFGLVGIWYVYRVDQNPLLLVVISLFTDQFGGGAAASSAVNSFASMSLGRALRRFVELYGVQFAYFVTAGVCFLAVARNTVRRRVLQFELESAVHMIVGAVLAVAFLAFDLIILDPIRVSRYLLLGSVFSIAVAAVKRDTDRAAVLVVAIVVLFSGILATGTVYRPNNHLTYTEQGGTEWLIEHENPNVVTVSTHSSYKLETYIEGAASERRSHRIYQPNNPRYRLPAHFGYPNHTSVSESIGYEAYIVTKTHDLRFYEWFPPSLREGRIVYTREDIRRLQSDQTASLVYTNGNFTVYKTSG
jgi:hypothetical protein